MFIIKNVNRLQIYFIFTCQAQLIILRANTVIESLIVCVTWKITFLLLLHILGDIQMQISSFKLFDKILVVQGSWKIFNKKKN